MRGEQPSRRINTFRLGRAPIAAPQRAAALPASLASIASIAAFADATAPGSLPRTTIWLLKRPSL